MPGCLGAWDASTAVAAETTLTRQGEWKLRTKDFTFEGSDVIDDESGLQGYGHSAPYMVWEDLKIDSHWTRDDSEYTDYHYQMCLCDTSSDCAAPTNWHDLGGLEVEAASRWFVGRSYQVVGGAFLNHLLSRQVLSLASLQVVNWALVIWVCRVPLRKLLRGRHVCRVA